jgi:predicted kinase
VNRIIILRGIPGSGKSTMVSNNWPSAVVASADHFFRWDGVYKYDPAKISQAHYSCFRTFLTYCQRGEPLIVVDNTCTTIAEVAPYVLAGESFGHRVTILTLSVPPEKAHARQVHGVPLHAIERMADVLEAETSRMPPWWSHTCLKEGMDHARNP